jgi:hypothetical protein
MLEPSKSKVTGSRSPANLAMEYRVLRPRSQLYHSGYVDEKTCPVVSEITRHVFRVLVEDIHARKSKTYPEYQHIGK